MKKLLIAAIAIVAAMPAAAKSPEKIGVMYAQADACRIQGHITRAQFKIIKLKISDKYNVARKDWKYKDRIKKAKKREFKRIEKQGDLGRAIKCSALKDKWR